MTSPLARSYSVVLLLLAACSVDDGGEDTGDASSTGGVGSSGASTDVLTDTGCATGCTTAADDCGDGILDPGEVCDPPGDACDVTCSYVDRSLWTVTRGGPDTPTTIHDVSVDSAGQIIVLGSTLEPAGDEWNQKSWLLALDADGAERWQATLPPEALDTFFRPHLAVDTSGIFVQGYGVHRFGPQGEPDWYVWPMGRAFATLAVAGGAVYAAGAEFGEYDPDSESQPIRLAVERLDAATGASTWKFLLADDTIDSQAVDVAMVGDRAFLVGAWGSRVDDRGGSLSLSLDAATGSGDAPVLTEQSYTAALKSVPSGELVLAFMDPTGLSVRRTGPDGQVRWTTVIEEEFDLRDLAVAPDESLLATGVRLSDAGPHGFLRALSSNGELTWSAGFAPMDPRDGAVVVAAAFGPDFLVVAGQDARGLAGGNTGWIRRVDPK